MKLFEKLHVWRIQRDMNHAWTIHQFISEAVGSLTLKANVLVQPDTPANLFLVVDSQLVLEEQVATLVDLLPVLPIMLFPSIHWTPLAIPDCKSPLFHPRYLFLIAPPDAVLLLWASRIYLWTLWESI